MRAEVIAPEGVAFDYAELTDAIATAAREAAARIKERVRGQQIAIFDIGRDLLAMKEALGHGHFLAWIDAEFGMTPRSAQNFMNVANTLGECETVSYLPPTVLYALAARSTPEPVRQEVVQRLESGEELPASQIRFMVKEAKVVERKAALEAKLKPAQKKYHERKQRDRAAEEAEWKARRQKQTEAAREAVIMVLDGLGDRAADFFALLKEAGGFEFERAASAFSRDQEHSDT